ncbi:MAG: nuclear transport factor 2 family protein [Candidatus Binatia bacterium]
MSHNADRLRQLFVDLERLDFAAVAAHCTEDCSYEDVPYAEATAVGRQAIAKLAHARPRHARTPADDVHELLEHGDTIMVERTEELAPSERRTRNPAVAAVFKFRDGLIRLWRDYWDAPTLFRQQPASWLPDIPR